MITSKEILQTAQLVIHEHDERAADEAIRMVHTMLSSGDLAGQSTWRLVLHAIDQLQIMEPLPGEMMH
jgi:hypothetical protein